MSGAFILSDPTLQRSARFSISLIARNCSVMCGTGGMVAKHSPPPILPIYYGGPKQGVTAGTFFRFFGYGLRWVREARIAAGS